MVRNTIVKIKMQTASYCELDLHIPNGNLKDFLKVEDCGFGLGVVYTDKEALEFLKIVKAESGLGRNTMTSKLVRLVSEESDKYIAKQTKDIQNGLQNIIDAGIKNLDDVENLRYLVETFNPSCNFINIEANVET